MPNTDESTSTIPPTALREIDLLLGSERASAFEE